MLGTVLEGGHCGNFACLSKRMGGGVLGVVRSSEPWAGESGWKRKVYRLSRSEMLKVELALDDGAVCHVMVMTLWPLVPVLRLRFRYN